MRLLSPALLSHLTRKKKLILGEVALVPLYEGVYPEPSGKAPEDPPLPRAYQKPSAELRLRL